MPMLDLVVRLKYLSATSAQYCPVQRLSLAMSHGRPGFNTHVFVSWSQWASTTHSIASAAKPEQRGVPSEAIPAGPVPSNETVRTIMHDLGFRPRTVIEWFDKTYEKGKKLGNEAMGELEKRLERLPGLPKWFVDIALVPAICMFDAGISWTESNASG
jgi:hypothetical protein